MMTHLFKNSLAGLILLLLWPAMTGAQIRITNVDKIPELKNGTTFVVMKDTSSAIAKEYIDVFKKYWTISKIKFIKSNDISPNIDYGSYFLTISSWTETSYGTATGSNVHIYLYLWTVKESLLNSKTKKKVTYTDLDGVGRIELFTDYKTLNNPEDLYKHDYDGGGHIRNWGPGMLKNYIQELMILLNEGQERSLFAATDDMDQLKELKKQTLYVPDYVLIKFGMMTGDESRKHKESEILGSYKYPHKLIPTKELNQKILNDTIPFYYLTYVKSSTDKFVSVVNSSTGEFIYTVYSPVSYNFKSDDMDRIYDKINGK